MPTRAVRAPLTNPSPKRREIFPNRCPPPTEPIKSSPTATAPVATRCVKTCPRQAPCAQCPRPTAIDLGDAPDHPDVCRQGREDVSKGQWDQRSDSGHLPCSGFDLASCHRIQRLQQGILCQPDQCLCIYLVATDLRQPLTTPAHVFAPGIKTGKLLYQGLCACQIVAGHHPLRPLRAVAQHGSTAPAPPIRGSGSPDRHR